MTSKQVKLPRNICHQNDFTPQHNKSIDFASSESSSYCVITGWEPQTQTAVGYHEKYTNRPAPEKMLLPHKQQENQIDK